MTLGRALTLYILFAILLFVGVPVEAHAGMKLLDTLNLRSKSSGVTIKNSNPYSQCDKTREVPYGKEARFFLCQRGEGSRLPMNEVLRKRTTSRFAGVSQCSGTLSASQRQVVCKNGEVRQVAWFDQRSKAELCRQETKWCYAKCSGELIKKPRLAPLKFACNLKAPKKSPRRPSRNIGIASHRGSR